LSTTQPLLRFQDYQFQIITPSGVWKWTTRVDVSQAVTSTQIRDIITPYGLLRDTIPIPGEVVQAMADSITELCHAYVPSILLSPTSLTFITDEGRGVSVSQPVLVTNNGVFGSLLATTITSSAPYVSPLPANVDGLVANASGTFNVSADSSTLLAVNSPFSASLTIQDPNASNDPQTVSVTVIVRPKATIAVSPTRLQFNVFAPWMGSFPAVPSQQISLLNSGLAASVLDFQIHKLIGVPWISYTPVYGSINGCASQPITVVVTPMNTMEPGVYNETLRFTGYSSNLFLDVPIILNIM